MRILAESGDVQRLHVQDLERFDVGSLRYALDETLSLTIFLCTLVRVSLHLAFVHRAPDSNRSDEMRVCVDAVL